MPLIYIILINYNYYKDTIDCVNSLRNISYSNYKIVIVDNNSINDSVKILRQNLKDCIIMESKQNLGFSGGNNLGIKYALDNKAQYIMLLNNDTLEKEDFLDNMLSSFNIDNDVGIVGCKIMYYPKKNVIWYGGGCIDWFKFIGIHYGIKEIDKGQCNISREIDFITGCCMLMKREVLEKVGLFTEEYFMYFEDVDFCVRVKNAGYKMWYNPKAVIYHKVGFSSGGEESPFSIKWCTRNRLFFMNKYRNKISKFNYLLSNIFFYITRIIRYFQYKAKGDNDRAKSIIDGIRMYKQLR